MKTKPIRIKVSAQRLINKSGLEIKEFIELSINLLSKFGAQGLKDLLSETKQEETKEIETESVHPEIAEVLNQTNKEQDYISIWKKLKPDIELLIDQKIDLAKRGY